MNDVINVLTAQVSFLEKETGRVLASTTTRVRQVTDVRWVSISRVQAHVVMPGAIARIRYATSKWVAIQVLRQCVELKVADTITVTDSEINIRDEAEHG